MHESTEVTWVEDGICVCNNCGAFADTPQKISHHKTCQPGEAKKWEAFYSEANEEEAAMGIHDYWEDGQAPDWEPDPDWTDSQKIVEVSFDILVHTTEKAFLLQIGEENIWFPKSEATLNMSMNNNTVLIPKWLAEEKGLEEHYTQEEKTEIEELFNKVMRKNIRNLKDDLPF